MPDSRIQYMEEMVGAGHPTKADTLNRLVIVEHNNDGSHTAPLANFIVEHNTDGTHSKLTKVTDPWVDIRAFLPDGYVTNGSVDYSAEIQQAINTVRDYANGKGGKVLFPLGWWNIGTTGLTLYEGVQLIGSGMSLMVSGAKAGGTWLVYTGTGNAITVDGEWDPWDSRRTITIENINISVQAGVNAAIYCDFLTVFRFDRVHIYGASTYGIYFINSYNGTIAGCRIDGPATGLYATIKASPNDVFSGQTLVMDTDIWNCTDKAVHIVTTTNVMAQWVFIKSHFRANAYGAYLDGTIQSVNFRGCHFEGATTTDLYVGSAVLQGPIVDGCYFNNTSTVWKIDCSGEKIRVINNTFNGSTTGHGVRLNGADGYIAGNHFQAVASSQILLDTSAARTTVGKNTHSVTASRVVDNSSAQPAAFEGELLLESKLFDLSEAAETEVRFVALRDYFVRDIRIIYIEATSADAGVALQFGDTDSLTRYVNHTSDTSQSAYAVVTPTLATNYIAKDRKVTFRCAGSKVGAGTAKFVARLIPYATA